ncbi:MAG: hypothetical protein K0R46_3263 [Herbinix sp.]|jgi:predicted  nucleic acid-binding Zn-ribbon protein|nr:hypothetical protein [Herbinix sp.]
MKIIKIRSNLKDIEKRLFSLEKQNREFHDLIEFYISKNSNTFATEIARFNRYLKSIDKEIRICMEKKIKLENELSKLFF